MILCLDKIQILKLYVDCLVGAHSCGRFCFDSNAIDLFFRAMSKKELYEREERNKKRRERYKKKAEKKAKKAKKGHGSIREHFKPS